jgi:hypothetical protein
MQSPGGEGGGVGNEALVLSCCWTMDSSPGRRRGRNRQPCCHGCLGTIVLGSTLPAGLRRQGDITGGVDWHRSPSGGLEELTSAFGNYAFVRTISVRFSECGFTHPSISEVFAGAEHQGEPLDKTIHELCKKPNLRFECDFFSLEVAYSPGPDLRLIQPESHPSLAITNYDQSMCSIFFIGSRSLSSAQTSLSFDCFV